MHRVSRSRFCAYKNLQMFCVFEQRFVFLLCLLWNLLANKYASIDGIHWVDER